MFKSILRWVAIGGVVAIPVVIPFIVSASMFFPYITGKNFTFRIIVEVVFAAWLLLAMLEAKYRPRFSWILAAFGLFVIIVGLADVFGANPFKSIWSNFERMEGWLALIHLFAYFVVASAVLSTEKLWNALWYSTLAASVAIAFIGIAPVLKALPDIRNIPRIDASFGNPIYLAVYSLFHIMIALVLMVRWRGTHWHQAILGFVALLHLVTMIFTMTRGTVLGFMGGGVITALLVALLERERKVLRWVATGILATLVLVAAGGYAVRNTEWAKTAPVVSRFTQIDLTSGTVNARFMNWGMAWHGVKERPILGWGQDNYEYVFSKYYDPNMYGEEPWFDRTHDIVFDWLIAAGFLGVIAYFLIPLSLLTHLWVLDPKEHTWSLKSLTSFSAIRTLLTKRDETFTATERALWTGLLAAYMFHNLFVFDNILSYILYVMVLAYLHHRVTETHSPLFGSRNVARETVLSVAFPVVGVCTGVIIWYLNVPGITTAQTLINALAPQRVAPSAAQSDYPKLMLEAYKQAVDIDQLGRQEVREQLAQAAANIIRNENVDAETRNEFRDLAISEMKKEIGRNENSARLWLFMGSLYMSAGDVTNAEQAFQKAVDLTPTKQTALFQLGEVKLMLGKTDEAMALFKKAYELAPAYDEARKIYALTLIRTGKDKEAVDLLTERFGTAAVDDSRLFMEWTNAKRFDIAAQILEARVAANPTDYQQRVSLAAAYKELGQRDKAIATLMDILKEKPEYAEQVNAFVAQIRAGK